MLSASLSLTGPLNVTRTSVTWCFLFVSSVILLTVTRGVSGGVGLGVGVCVGVGVGVGVGIGVGVGVGVGVAVSVTFVAMLSVVRDCPYNSWTWYWNVSVPLKPGLGV